jgi:hypothetical protein
MSTITWRTKLAFLAGVTLMPVGLLAFAVPAAGAAPSTAATHRAAGPSPAPQAAPQATSHATSAASHSRASSHAHGPGNGNPPASRSGDNGTVKIHNSTTPVTDPRNEPHVCHFYLDGFGFDASQSVSWRIESWPPTGNRSLVAQGGLTMDSNGNGHTWPPMTLADGHYKLFWNFTGEHGFAKQKVFWVKCPAPTSPPTTPPPSETPSPSGSTVSSSPGAPPPPSPSGGGGLPITGWPLALIAGVGAVLLGTGGTAIAVARRHRGLHSSR